MSNPKALIHLEQDLATTTQDVAALRRLAGPSSSDFLAVLTSLYRALPAQAKGKRDQAAAGREPFEL